jgi:hypothetical protein
MAASHHCWRRCSLFLIGFGLSGIARFDQPIRYQGRRFPDGPVKPGDDRRVGVSSLENALDAVRLEHAEGRSEKHEETDYGYAGMDEHNWLLRDLATKMD